MIPKNGWKDMDSAPQDGTILIARYIAWNKYGQPDQIHAVQWLCDDKGQNWTWRHPWTPGRTAYAHSWMTYEEFKAAQIEEEAQSQRAASPEFDL